MLELDRKQTENRSDGLGLVILDHTQVQLLCSNLLKNHTKEGNTPGFDSHGINMSEANWPIISILYEF